VRIEIGMWVELILSSNTLLPFLLASLVELILLFIVGGGVRGAQEGRTDAHPSELIARLQCSSENHVAGNQSTASVSYREHILSFENNMADTAINPQSYNPFIMLLHPGNSN
jgi:hypothetical protein